MIAFLSPIRTEWLAHRRRVGEFFSFLEKIRVRPPVFSDPRNSRDAAGLNELRQLKPPDPRLPDRPVARRGSQRRNSPMAHIQTRSNDPSERPEHLFPRDQGRCAPLLGRGAVPGPGDRRGGRRRPDPADPGEPEAGGQDRPRLPGAGPEHGGPDRRGERRPDPRRRGIRPELRDPLQHLCQLLDQDGDPRGADQHVLDDPTAGPHRQADGQVAQDRAGALPRVRLRPHRRAGRRGPGPDRLAAGDDRAGQAGPRHPDGRGRRRDEDGAWSPDEAADTHGTPGDTSRPTTSGNP